MLKNLLFFLFLFLASLGVQSQYTDRQIIVNMTGYGLDANQANGIAPEQWAYVQKFVNITYNGQDASVSAIRFHLTWRTYEPTLNDYKSAKLVQAVQAMVALKPGLKVALHFPFLRGGLANDHYFADEDMARSSNGQIVGDDYGGASPSIYSAYAKSRYLAFVNNAMTTLAANNLLGNILYVEMGNTTSEEYLMPFHGNNALGFYEDKAVAAWRTQYLPCRYPGQSSVTWNGNTYQVSSAPVATNPYGDWNNEHQREYHRFGAWGLMNFYKGFRDAVRAVSPSMKVVYFISDFGGEPGSLKFLTNPTIPMALNEFDGIYTSAGNNTYDGDAKILPIDVIKGTNNNKIAAIEFDQVDVGQGLDGQPDEFSNISTSYAMEWFTRAYKHGVNNIHLAMLFRDQQIEQLKPVLAAIRATYLNPSYTAPARQTPVSTNLFPNVFQGGIVGAWQTQNGGNWSVTDNNPVSVNLTDNGYWENIWSCSSTPDPCAYNISASASNGSPTVSTSVTLTAACSGQCSGVSYAWSGNGISGSGSSITFNAPSTAGNYSYTLTASKSGCSPNKTTTVSLNVQASGGGTNPCNYVDKQTVGTWSGLNVQTRQYTVNGSTAWLIVTAVPGSSVDKHFPRGKNFADRGDISWSNGVINKTCLVGGETGYGGLVFPSGVTVPSGYTQGTETDGAIYFQQSGGCSTPAAPSLSASPSTITTSGGSSTLSASGCSGGTITWSTGATGTSTSVSPTSTTTYTATCSIGGCTSSAASVTVTVNISGGSSSYSQCKESESSTGNGAITSDPNASNGSTRGEENNNSHYVDYALTGVPSAGTYYVTLRYYSSSAPTVGVQVNSGSTTTVNLANSGSWNIVWTTQQISVTLAAGNNTVRISGTGGGSCRQDRICVSNTSGSPAVLGIDPAEINTVNIKKAMSISPNPSKGIFETNFYLEKGKKATIIISDLQGRIIYRQAVTGQGQHRERINLNNKAAGTLIVQLQKETGAEVKKINITR